MTANGLRMIERRGFLALAAVGALKTAGPVTGTDAFTLDLPRLQYPRETARLDGTRWLVTTPMGNDATVYNPA